MRVGLFIPCYVDQFYPQVGIATLELLEKYGCEVVYPAGQTCCGQPMANSGFEHLTKGKTRTEPKTLSVREHVSEFMMEHVRPDPLGNASLRDLHAHRVMSHPDKTGMHAGDVLVESDDRYSVLFRLLYRGRQTGRVGRLHLDGDPFDNRIPELKACRAATRRDGQRVGADDAGVGAARAAIRRLASLL